MAVTGRTREAARNKKWKVSVWGQRHFGGRLSVESVDQPGVFETFRIDRGRVLWPEDHLERFEESARALGIEMEPARGELKAWLTDRVACSGIRTGAGRLAGWGGQNSRPGQRVLWLRALSGLKPAGDPKPIHLRTSSVRAANPRDTDLAVKSNHYLTAIWDEVSQSASKEKTLALFLNSEGWVTESAVANVFALRGGALWTPHPSCGILVGITRRRMMEAARILGFACFETRFTRHEIYQSDEVFLTSSLSTVIPVREVDGRRIGDGEGGRRWKEIRDKYFELSRL